ncbi:MAG: maltose alpha-D-glucosyltransferase [Bacteroidales bacterium]
MREISNSLWYKDAIIYQLHVRSFYDSTGDGIGDFKGLIRKLDYIQSLGVNTIWLLPFYPSPLKDGGYDIADFTGIHQDYGTLADFRRFVTEAHKRGLRIIAELVLNHTSKDHKWFQRARQAKPGSVFRDYYVWSETPDKFLDARIIFQDFEVSNWTYDHVAGAYYWHRFYSHQPDLNFDSPRVQQEILRVLDFWFKIGVDGFRLDAVPYLFEEEGTNCENLPPTHTYLKSLRKYVDDKYGDKLLLAEANQWPDDASAYFGDGDECHMAFHFPVMPRLYMALRMEDRFPVVDILEQTPSIPENCQWAIFLRNHDELTLEMVSDEERDYMYRAFAKDPKKRVNVGIRRRLFPLLGGDSRSIELLNILLLSLPGTPVIYYGDEIGMGDNYYLGDRDGVRTPMQWSPDKNAGFSHADPQQLFLPLVIDPHYHYTSVNVENQEKNPSSFLWWQRRVIAKRRQYQAFGRGRLQFINTSNPKILAFVRSFNEEKILVVVNLSRYSQHVELDLSQFAGSTPVEAFSRNEFPLITEEPWSFSMQFKNYFWFELRAPGKEVHPVLDKAKSPICIRGEEWNRMDVDLQYAVRDRLYDYLVQIKWFKGDTRKLRNINVLDVIPLAEKKYTPFLVIIELDLIEDNKYIYLMPISLISNNKAEEIRGKYPHFVIAPVEVDQEEGIIFDGSIDRTLHESLFDVIRRRSQIKGINGNIRGKSGSLLRKQYDPDEMLHPHMIPSRQTNSSIVYGDRFFLRIYRSPQEGENPDVEILKNLTRKTDFQHMPAYLGRLDYRNPNLEDTSVAVLQELIPNVGNAWDMTQTSIEGFFDKILTEKMAYDQIGQIGEDDMDELIGSFYLEMVQKLAVRTAEMHQALGSIEELAAFKPEPFSLLYQKSLYQALRTYVKRTFLAIEKEAGNVPESSRELLFAILGDQDVFLKNMRQILESGKLPAIKTRIHGNYKLDKVLFTGKDFKIINFEGELERSLSVRKIKHSPLRDVATMLQSLHYAIYKGYFLRKEFVPVDSNYLRPCLDRWYQKVSKTFLNAYCQHLQDKAIIPDDKDTFEDMLNLYMFEKAIQELHSFVDHEPESAVIPLKILQKLK